jgi:hypothetical protein
MPVFLLVEVEEQGRNGDFMGKELWINCKRKGKLTLDINVTSGFIVGA